MKTEIKVHELKTWPEYFQEVKNGNKNFEFRDNDRDFKVGDTVILKEWKPNEWTPHVGNYTGDEITMRISYVLTEGFGLPFGKAIISLLPESVATPEAEIEKKAEKILAKIKPVTRSVNGEFAWTYESIEKAMVEMYKAAIKKDEPDLVASDREKLINFLMTIDECYGMHVREDAERCVDNYLASVPSNDEASLATLPCTSSNSIEHEADDAYCAHQWLDDLCVPRLTDRGDKYSLVGRIAAYGRMCEPQNYKQ